MGGSLVSCLLLLQCCFPISTGPPNGSTGCQKLNAADLTRRMRDIGQFNEKYMAATLDEAGRYFTDLTDAHFVRPAQQSECDRTCQDSTDNVKRLLNGKGQPVDGPAAQPPNTAGRKKRASRQGIRLDNVGKSYLLYCSPEGFQEQPGFHKLCGGCRSVRELPDNYFPRFLNEVRCSKTKCVKEHGQCVQKYLNFDILRNDGTADCQRWVPYTANVPVCCDCMLSSQSAVFLSLVQKE